MNDLVSTLGKKGGIYFLSYTNQHGKNLVKIGCSTRELWRRLDSYLLYYPTGFYVFGVYVCKSRTSGKAIKKLESEIHAYCNGKNFNPRHDHSHSSEWFEFDQLASLYSVLEDSVWINEDIIEKRQSFEQSPFFFYATAKAGPRKQAPFTPKRRKAIEVQMKAAPQTDKTVRLKLVKKSCGKKIVFK